MLLALQELRHLLRSQNTFLFNGQHFRYFDGPYNSTKNNERSIEIPLIKYFYDQYQPKSILEVGNVLQHYFPELKHDVVDKYEKADGVINKDVVSFKSKKKYKLIISISTLEHVGWDEYPRDPQKFEQAIAALFACLQKGGSLIFSVPLGYNHDLDSILRANQLGLTEQHYFKRLTSNNIWQQRGAETLAGAKYNYPFPNANELLLGIITKS